MIEHIIPIITIWIHGTRPTEMVPPFLQSITASIENVLFVDKSQKHLLSIHDLTHHEYLSAIATTYSNAKKSNLEDFYFFPWSGRLDPKARIKAAEQLAQEIEQLLSQYKTKYKGRPVLDIIAHSHGGNVALLLANQERPSFSVDNLILLGCPIQLKTRSLVTSLLFHNIYNVHSHNDWIQVLDPQGVHILFDQDLYSDFFGLLNNFFSARHFTTENENVTQIHVRWNAESDQTDPKIDLFPRWLSNRLKYASKLPFRRGLFHIEFTLLPFVKRLPEIIATIENQETESGKVDIDITVD
jgi:hypothetical protein